MNKKLTVTDAAFDRALAKYEKAAMIEFFADWCPHCKRMGPVVDQLAKMYGDKIGILSVDVDQSPVSSQKYGVRGIPTFVFIKDGKVKETVSGELPEEELKKRLDDL